MTSTELNKELIDIINWIEYASRYAIYKPYISGLLSRYEIISDYLNNKIQLQGNKISKKLEKEYKEFKKEADDLKKVIEVYGIDSKYRVLYSIYNNIYTVRNTVNSKDKELINSIIDIIGEDTEAFDTILRVNSMNLSYYNNTPHKIKTFNNDIGFTDFIIGGMLLDLSRLIKRYFKVYIEEIDKAISSYSDIADKDTIYELNHILDDAKISTSLNVTYSLAISWSFSGIYKVIIPDYKGLIQAGKDISNIWPFSTDIKSTILNQLQWLDLSESKISKMKLLGANEYNSLSMQDIIFMQIIKNILKRVQ